MLDCGTVSEERSANPLRVARVGDLQLVSTLTWRKEIMCAFKNLAVTRKQVTYIDTLTLASKVEQKKTSSKRGGRWRARDVYNLVSKSLEKGSVLCLRIKKMGDDDGLLVMIVRESVAF